MNISLLKNTQHSNENKKCCLFVNRIYNKVLHKSNVACTFAVNLNYFLMKQNQIEKKEQEIRAIQPLLEKYNAKIISDLTQERPDLILDYGGMKIGLEVVRCSPSAKFNKKRKASLAAESCKYRKAGLKQYENLLLERDEKIAVDVRFKNAAYWITEPQKTFCITVITEIEQLRKSNLARFDKGERVSSDNNLDTIYVESIQLIPIVPQKALVISLGGQAIQKATQDDFINCLLPKMKKLAKYTGLEKNKDIDEYWLAISMYFDEPYEFWDVPYAIPQNCEYTRIFLIQYDEIRELPACNA